MYCTVKVGLDIVAALESLMFIHPSIHPSLITVKNYAYFAKIKHFSHLYQISHLFVEVILCNPLSLDTLFKLELN